MNSIEPCVAILILIWGFLAAVLWTEGVEPDPDAPDAWSGAPIRNEGEGP